MNFAIDYSDYDESKPYAGIGVFKLSADHPFNRAAYAHDELYKIWLAEDTFVIDVYFWELCMQEIDHLYAANLISIEHRIELTEQACHYYKLCRAWGKIRYKLAKARGWNYLLRR